MTDAAGRAPKAPLAAGSLGRDALVTLGYFAVLGVAAGVCWWLLVEPVEVTRYDVGIGIGEAALAKQFGANGWYAVIAMVAGLVSGVVVTAWRSRDLVATVLLCFVGALLAAWLSATVGSALGPEDPTRALTHAEVGATAPAAFSVTAKAVYLIWPLFVLAGSLLVLWSTSAEPPRDLEPAETRPGGPGDAR